MKKLALLSIAILVFFAPRPATGGEHVNIIVILADDLGYGDLSCYGHSKFKTPNLDALAKSGMKLNHFYTPVPFCAPTRGSLLTGRYPARNGLTSNPCPKEDPASRDKTRDEIGLPVNETTLADLLRAAGYRTSHIGKWHLGHLPHFRPLRRGFHEYFGILYSNDMHRVELIDGNYVTEFPVVQATLTKRYTEKAIDFIQRNKDRPFFLYLAHAMPHKPLACSEAFYGKTKAGLYGDVITELDWSVGQIMDTLKTLKLDSNTLVIFTSDNGPWYGGSTGGLRGMKSQNFEGGLRVPFIASWPGRIPAGRESNEPAIMMDVFTTSLKAAGVALPKNRKLDGANLLPLLMSKKTESLHSAIYSFRGPNVCTVRSGRWKLHLLPSRKRKIYEPNEKWLDPRRPNGVTLLAPFEQPHPSDFPGVQTGDEVKKFALFDLEADKAEQHDVSKKHPDLVKKLTTIARQFESDLKPKRSSRRNSPKFFISAQAQPEKIRLTHGPMLGRASAHAMGVWARTSHPGPFHVKYGLSPDALTSTSPTATTKLDNDNTGWIVLKNLNADTKYYYQLFAGADGKTVGLGGSFRTLPDSKDYEDKKHNPKGLFNFRFEFACGNNQGFHSLGTKLPTFQTMLKKNLPDKIHFAILNGDWLYEDKRDFNATQWLKKQHLAKDAEPNLVKLAPTITGVWENYAEYLTRGKPLANWHRNVPSFYTFDDHEIVNDVNGCGEIGYRNRRAVFRDIALQAWEDYLGWSNPMTTSQGIHFGKAKVIEGSSVLYDPNADFTKIDWKQAANLHIHWNTADAGFKDTKSDTQGGDPNSAVYGVENVIDKHRLRIRPAIKATGDAYYSIGRLWYGKMRVSNCDFYFLDTRSHRMKHDIQNPKKKGISILGDRQRQWLMDEMAKSDADFFFVVSSVNFVIPHVGAGGMAKAAADKDDAWTVFLHEREELINFWDKLKRPVFVLTGDLHNSFAIKISDYVWEFASGPHNSRNHDANSEGGRPANGIFDSRGHKADILWSSYFLTDVPVSIRRQPVYCVVQINNVFNNPLAKGENRWVAFPRPQVVFQYYDGFTGDMLFATSIRATRR